MEVVMEAAAEDPLAAALRLVPNCKFSDAEPFNKAYSGGMHDSGPSGPLPAPVFGSGYAHGVSAPQQPLSSQDFMQNFPGAFEMADSCSELEFPPVGDLLRSHSETSSHLFRGPPPGQAVRKQHSLPAISHWHHLTGLEHLMQQHQHHLHCGASALGPAPHEAGSGSCVNGFKLPTFVSQDPMLFEEALLQWPLPEQASYDTGHSCAHMDQSLDSYSQQQQPACYSQFFDASMMCNSSCLPPVHVEPLLLHQVSSAPPPRQQQPRDGERDQQQQQRSHKVCYSSGDWDAQHSTGSNAACTFASFMAGQGADVLASLYQAAADTGIGGPGGYSGSFSLQQQQQQQQQRDQFNSQLFDMTGTPLMRSQSVNVETESASLSPGELPITRALSISIPNTSNALDAGQHNQPSHQLTGAGSFPGGAHQGQYAGGRGWYSLPSVSLPCYSNSSAGGFSGANNLTSPTATTASKERRRSELLRGGEDGCLCLERKISCKTYCKRLHVTQVMADNLLPLGNNLAVAPVRQASGKEYTQLFKHSISLVDEAGASYPVDYEGVLCCSQKHLRLTTGWRLFVQAQKITVGDTVTFERRGENRHVIFVRVRRGDGGADDAPAHRVLKRKTDDSPDSPGYS